MATELPVVTLAEARAHLRLELDYPAEQVQTYLDGAIDAAERYLNRRVFPSAASLDAAMDTAPSVLSLARMAYDAAIVIAASIVDTTERLASMSVAARRWDDACVRFEWTLEGVVVTSSIRSAILLTLGHLYANRSDVLLGSTATELPRGARDLIRPLRRVMGP